MKLHDFGLWFETWVANEWSKAIPKNHVAFSIWYNGVEIGWQREDGDLCVYSAQPYIMQVKDRFTNKAAYAFCPTYSVGLDLTLDDFEIVPNPDYPGDP